MNSKYMLLEGLLTESLHKLDTKNLPNLQKAIRSINHILWPPKGKGIEINVYQIGKKGVIEEIKTQLSGFLKNSKSCLDSAAKDLIKASTTWMPNWDDRKPHEHPKGNQVLKTFKVTHVYADQYSIQLELSSSHFDFQGHVLVVRIIDGKFREIALEG